MIRAEENITLTRVDDGETGKSAYEAAIEGGLPITTTEQEFNEDLADVPQLDERITQAENDIGTIEGNITSLQGRVQTAEGKITTVEGNITSLGTRVGTAETKLSDIEDDIDDLDEKTQQAEAAISSELSSFKTITNSAINRIDAQVEDVEYAAGEAEAAATAATTAANNAGIAASIAQAAAEAADGKIDNLEEYFWHDYLGAHITDSSKNYRNDLTSEGMKIVNRSGNVIAQYGGEGYTIGNSAVGSGTYQQATADDWKIITINGQELAKVDTNTTSGTERTITILGFNPNPIIDDDDGDIIIDDDILLLSNSPNASYEGGNHDWFFQTGVELTPQFRITRIQTTDTMEQIPVNEVSFNLERTSTGGIKVASVQTVQGYDSESISITYKSVADSKVNVDFGVNYSSSQGDNSNIIGMCNRADGAKSTAIGVANTVRGIDGMAFGTGCNIEGMCGTAIGYNNIVLEKDGMAIGNNLISSNESEMVIGSWNNPNDNELAPMDLPLIVGIGTGVEARKNGLALDSEGNLKIRGKVYIEANDDSTGGTELGSGSSHNHDNRYYTKTQMDTSLAAKQNTLTAGTNITISGNTISATGGGITQAQLLNFVYPVGSIYMSVNNVSPQTFLGGTWVAVSQGRVLVGAGTGTDEEGLQQTYAAGDTGGVYEKIMSEDNLPEHSHTISHTHSYTDTTYSKTAISKKPGSNSATTTGYNITGTANSKTSGAASTSSIVYTGLGMPMNIEQPYLAVYMWKRTA